MPQISIPKEARTVIDKDTFYVIFPFEAEELFEKWCEENNIGWNASNRQDITKSYFAVFTDMSNKEIFTN